MPQYLVDQVWQYLVETKGKLSGHYMGSDFWYTDTYTKSNQVNYNRILNSEY